MPITSQPLVLVLLALPFFAFGLVQDVSRAVTTVVPCHVATYIWRPLAILVLLIAVVLAGWTADASTTTLVAVTQPV